MTASRVLLSVALILTAAILQVTVVNRLPLPGTGPDLVLLVVIGLAGLDQDAIAGTLRAAAG